MATRTLFLACDCVETDAAHTLVVGVLGSTGSGVAGQAVVGTSTAARETCIVTRTTLLVSCDVEETRFADTLTGGRVQGASLRIVARGTGGAIGACPTVVQTRLAIWVDFIVEELLQTQTRRRCPSVGTLTRNTIVKARLTGLAFVTANFAHISSVVEVM